MSAEFMVDPDDQSSTKKVDINPLEIFDEDAISVDNKFIDVNFFDNFEPSLFDNKHIDVNFLDNF
ncbi:hypothetical protein CRYUN_Cryun19dG0039500 [Craigia yunnanensis]